MAQEDIVKMARKAGIAKYGLGWTCWEGQLEAFAALVAAAEREACAKFIEDEYVRQFDEPWRHNLAAAIRARGEK